MKVTITDLNFFRQIFVFNSADFFFIQFAAHPSWIIQTASLYFRRIIVFFLNCNICVLYYTMGQAIDIIKLIISFLPSAK